VVELERAARRAAAPHLPDERALAGIALPDCAADVGRDAALPCGRPGLAPWPERRRELPSFELANQGIERTVEHVRDLTGRNGMTEQRLRMTQLVVRRFGDRDLEREAVR
jgi:hypothetical protein